MDKALLTGASGFLGKIIYKELRQYNDVISISRSGAVINVDLTKCIPKLPNIDLVVHCAGKAHSVPKTDVEKQTFFNVNLIGTDNLLKGLDHVPVLPKHFIFISTVAVYGCDSGEMLDETTPLQAKDAYGQSKIQAEQLVIDWCVKNKVISTILRLPLLAGAQPPGNLGAMISGLSKGYYFNISGGKAKKSIVMAEDVAKLIPVVASIGGVYNLTDGYHPSFNELSANIARQLGRPKPKNLPFWVAKIMAMFGGLLGSKAPINSDKLKKIISDLTFDDTKARKILNWNPSMVLKEFKIK